MVLTLKMLHFICLFGGGAAIIGNGVLMRKVVASGEPPSRIVAETVRVLGLVGLGAIVLLWITGYAMLKLSGMAPGWVFYLKLAAAAAVLGAVVVLSVLAARAERAGRQPDPERMKAIAMVSTVGTVLATILAVITFG